MDSTDQRVYLNGYIDVPKNRLETIQQALPMHVKLSRAEFGCISFEVSPDSAIEGRYHVAEVFIDETAFKAHQLRNQNSQWYKVSNGIPRQYTIKIGNKTTSSP